MSSLAEALAAEKASFRKGPACGIEVVLGKIDDTDRTELTAALNDRDIPSTVIVRALKKAGLDVSASSLNRHRNGECRCPV